jgi:hypothetical protein
MAELNPIKGLNDAKSIEDLQKLGSVPCQDPRLLIQVSQIFLKAAKESELNGDQEKAYVCTHSSHVFTNPEFPICSYILFERKKKSLQ